MTRLSLFSSSSPAKSFLLGGVAGAVLLGTGLFLGGAQRGRHHDDRPDASFGALTAQRLDIVDRRGRVRLRLRGNADDGGNIRVLDENGDLRVQLRADGSVLTYGGNEKLRARLGRDPHAYASRRPGTLELYDEYGRLISKLPGDGHDDDCTCEVCSGTYRPWGDRDHDERDHDHDSDGHHRDRDSNRDAGYGDEHDPYPRRRRWGTGEDNE